MRILAAAMITGLGGTAALAQEDEGWQFGVTPYLWVASLSGDMNFGLPDLNVDAEDILGHLDFGFLLAGEARKDQWLVLADVVYLKMSDTDSQTVNLPSSPGTSIPVDASLSVENWIVDVYGGYTAVRSDRLHLDLLAGVRYLNMSTDLSLRSSALPETENLSSSPSVWNGVVGARGAVVVHKRWNIPYHLDLGLGESDFTWQGMAGVSYAFNWGDVLAVYRYLSFEQDGPVDTLSIHGPAVGATIRF